MRKYNPAIHYQDVALEVPEGDLVDVYINKTSLYRLVLKKLNIKHMKYVRINDKVESYFTPSVPAGDLVNLDLHETSLHQFVLKNWT